MNSRNYKSLIRTLGILILQEKSQLSKPLVLKPDNFLFRTAAGILILSRLVTSACANTASLTHVLVLTRRMGGNSSNKSPSLWEIITRITFFSSR